MEQNAMDTIYRTIPLDKIPWNRETPPEAFIKLVENGKVRPCKTIDLGCGVGNYAIYLTQKGFQVTGLDFSPTAIEKAKDRANKQGVKCRFLVADINDLKENELDKLGEEFDFAYDWQVLHHIFPEKRDGYVQSVYSFLNQGGKYLSVCLSEKDAYFKDTGKYRETPLGTTLYFSSEDELRKLFSPYFTIMELKTIEIEAKVGGRMVNYAFMEKRELIRLS